MKIRSLTAVGALALLAFLTGCETRSISNSGFNNYSYGSTGGYRGELSEFDVLGVAPEQSVSEADIQSALKAASGTKLSRASKILLIQSGADFPDNGMMEPLAQRFQVTPFSGTPPQKDDKSNRASYAQALRLTAARGGYDKILCYWGVLESAREVQATKLVSWVPIAGYIIPDERETMRMRLKAVIVDVATGQWQFVQPQPVMSSEFSSVHTRVNTDQGMVEKLKNQGYTSLTRLLLDAYTI